MTNKLSQELQTPEYSCDDEVYYDFCNTISAAVKLSIPHDRRKNDRSYWNEDCEHLYQAFLQIGQVEATCKAASLQLSKFDVKRNDC